MSNLKQSLIVIVAIIGSILILIFQQGLYSKDKTTPLPSTQNQAKPIQTDTPEVISTNPSPLEENIVSPTQNIEITFNLQIENQGEFKNKIETFTDYKIELSQDRKTAKIVPLKPFKLGTSYTLFILPDTKFDGSKKLNREIIYHFKTINYQGV